MDKKDRKIITDGISALLVIALIVVLVVAIFTIDQTVLSNWLEQSISTLTIKELIVMLLVFHMLFSGGK